MSTRYIQGSPVDYQGRTDGVAVPAGYIGEKITWVTPPVNQNTTTTESDWTNAAISLTAGTWLIQANVCMVYSAGTNVGDQGYAAVKLTDSSNAVVDNQAMIVGSNFTASATAYGIGRLLVPLTAVVNLNGAATYKLRIYHVNNAGTNIGSTAENSGVTRSTFFAIRIA